MTQQRDLKFTEKFCAGALAGVTELVVMYPLDVIKTRAQLAYGKNISVLKMFVDLVKTKKFGIYRGILPPFLIEGPKRATKFSSFETYKSWLKGSDGKTTKMATVFAGCCAGATEAFVIAPFELVKIRLQAAGSSQIYANTFDAVIKIVKSHGIKEIYRGIESTIWRNFTWNGGYFGSIVQVKSMINKNQVPQNGRDRMTVNMIAGCIAGTIGTILNTPFDVVKSRIQWEGKNAWTLPTLMEIFKREGPLALYKGFAPKVARLGPGGGIMLVVFEKVSSMLQNRN